MSVIFRAVTRLTPAALLPFGRNSLDSVQPNAKEPTTGLERLHRIFILRNEDAVSVELNLVIQSSMAGGFFGACFGGFHYSRHAHNYFIENNEATIFKTTLDAKSKLQHAVTIAFGKGAFRWGWRLGLFTGVYSLVTTSMQVYRDKHTILEYLVAGAVTGGIFRVHMGLAATLVGTVLGTLLSGVAGGVILTIFTLAGIEIEDVRKAMFKIREIRERQMFALEEQASSNKHDEVTDHHTAIIEERGEKKIEEM